MVFCAGGGIGWAPVESIRATQTSEHVVAFSRSTSPSIDLMDEGSLECASAFAADQGERGFMIDAKGFLHGDRQKPEMSWRQRDPVNLARRRGRFAILAPAAVHPPRLWRSPDEVKREGWREQGVLAVSVDDHRPTWPEPELVRQLGDKLYGPRPSEQEARHG